MTPSEIKQKRTQSILKETIPEALSTLDDELLSGLCVTDVLCHKGRYDADVYLDKMMFTDSEIATILNRLNKAKSYIQSYCANKEGWFKTPSFKFYFDDLLKNQNQIDELFKKVEEELKRQKSYD